MNVRMPWDHVKVPVTLSRSHNYRKKGVYLQTEGDVDRDAAGYGAHSAVDAIITASTDTRVSYRLQLLMQYIRI